MREHTDRRGVCGGRSPDKSRTDYSRSVLAVPLIEQLNDGQLLTLRVAVEESATRASPGPLLASADGVRLSADELASRIPLPVETTTGLSYQYVDDVFADMLALAVQMRGFETVRRSFVNVATRRQR